MAALVLALFGSTVIALLIALAFKIKNMKRDPVAEFHNDIKKKMNKLKKDRKSISKLNKFKNIANRKKT